MKRWLIRPIRRWWYTRLARRTLGSFQEPLAVNGRSKFTANTHLGANTHFNGLLVKGTGKVTIGSNFHSGSGCAIMTQNHNYLGEALPYDHTYIVRDVVIGDNVWLGEQVTILPGATIGEGAIIQACSVVVGHIPPLAIAGGHPCRPFAARDKDKYEALKRAGKFN